MNKNKILIVLIVIVILLIGGYLIIYDNRIKYPESTGGKFETPSPEEIDKGDAISSLQKQLPYITEKFTITQFDYKTARFVVEFKEKTATSEQEFLDWLSASPFSPIPQKRFKFGN